MPNPQAIWGPPTTLTPATSNFLEFTSTVAGLSTYPAANYDRKYLWVSDLFGGPGDYCLSDGQFWKPVRPFYTGLPAAQTMTLQCLANAPTNLFQGTLATGAVANVTLGTANAYPGAVQHTVSEVSGLGTLNIIGIVGSVLGLNTWMRHEYFAGIGWKKVAGGTL